MAKTQEKPLTLDVPTAGAKYFGLGRSAAYAAARAGQLPVIRIGRKLRCPVVAAPPI